MNPPDHALKAVLADDFKRLMAVIELLPAVNRELFIDRFWPFTDNQTTVFNQLIT